MTDEFNCDYPAALLPSAFFPFAACSDRNVFQGTLTALMTSNRYCRGTSCISKEGESSKGDVGSRRGEWEMCALRADED